MTWILATLMLQAGPNPAEFRLTTPAAIEAEVSKRFQVSFGLGIHVGDTVLEGYRTYCLDGRYVIDDLWDGGLRFEVVTTTEPFELPGSIEKLDPSGEIDSQGDVTIIMAYANYHPWGRHGTVDAFLGAGLAVHLLDGEDVTRPGFYDLEVDTPPALGLALRFGMNWFLHADWAVTIDVSYTLLSSDYKITDRISGFSDNFDSTRDIGINIGLLYTF